MFKNFIDNVNRNPVMLAGILQSIVPVLVVFNLVQWTEAQTAVLYTAVTAILTAFVRGNTVAAPRVEEKVQERVAQREMAGTTGTGEGMTQKVPAVLLALVLGASIACAKTPPDLTPEASKAFKGTQVVKALDVLRDTAIAAHAQAPPLLSEVTTRKVVTYHQSVVKTLQALPEGWVAFTLKGLDELLTDLPPRERSLLTPYVTLVKTVVAEVTR